jgi:TonB-linked SusC/RagA family outer membrane protein
MYKIIHAFTGMGNTRVLMKSLLIMKLVIILLAASFLQVSAATYGQKISLTVKDAPLKEVFKQLRKQSGYNFLYDSDVLTMAKPVSFSFRAAPLEDVLKICFEQQPFTYTFNLNTVIVRQRSQITEQKKVPRRVGGLVTDEKGQSLPGVTVKVKGTTIGLVTDTAGRYMITAEENATLVFSFIGFTTEEIPIDGKTQINVILRGQSSSLSEVVVVGYGTQRKSDVNGAISSVSSNTLKDQPGSNFGIALEGKTSGVQVVQNSGAPGSTPQVRIRGLTSINNSDPLYVVDGIPLASNDINIVDPENIESIDILKDASAQAIYGSRGANGVVLVKTKKGNKNNSIITLSTYQGISNVRKTLDMLNAQDYVKLNTEAYNNAGQSNPFGDPSQYTQTTNWQKELFRTGYAHNYNLAVSGGSDKMTYRVTGSNLDQTGIMEGSFYKRLNVTNNLTFNLKPNLEFGESFAINRTKNSNVESNGNLVNSSFAEDPTIPVKLPSGNYSATKFSDIINPLATINYLINNHSYNVWGLLGNTYLQYKPLKGLALRTSYSTDIKFSDDKQFTPTYDVAPNFRNTNASVYQQKDNATSWTWDNTATYDFDIQKEHHFTVLAGVSMARFTYNYVHGYNQGQPGNDPYLQYLDAGISNQQVGGSQQQWDLLSYIGRLNYNYKGTYYLTATIRRDGSSKFGTNNRYGNFPSAAVGWNLTNESFFPKNNTLTYLKLRGSWGIVGNQAPVGYYDYSAVIYNNYYALGNPAVAVPTTEPGGLPNPNLKWEQDKQWNAGFDYQLFGGRLSGSFDYYKKASTDMLLSLNILSESGFTQGPRENAGSMQNSGFEFSADYNQSISNDFKLNAGMHFATINNKILDLRQNGQKIYSGGFKPGNFELTEVGHSAASFYGYVADGIFQNAQEVASHAKQQTGTALGDIRFKDLNGDGIINQDDQTFLGSPIPKLTYGFNIGASYKNFDLNAYFSGVYGNKIAAAYEYYTYGFFVSNYNMQTDALGRWTGPGTSNFLPRLIASDPNNNSRLSSFYLQSGSYLRLQNVTLGYTFPRPLLSKIGVKSVRLYFSGQNLLTFTKYKGYDPEVGTGVNGNGGTLDLGVDQGIYPQSRTITAGANLSF